jgi:AcrR family transcriptional regulator
MRSPALHDSSTAVRRPPYGANPALGRHGLRARQEILDAARRLFAERGYHATTVESIGQAAGRSGASVYQYFEGKGQIFEVFIAELTSEVVAQACGIATMERVQPGPAALAEVRARVAGLSEVMTRHAATFALWPVVEESEEGLRGSARRFMATFAETTRPVLHAAGVPPHHQPPLAVAIGAMVQSSHAMRAARAPEVSPDALDELLAQVVCAAIFPGWATPEPFPGERAAPARLPRPAGACPQTTRDTVPGVRRPVTARSRGTLDRILGAAKDAFRRNGFVGTSINDIAVAAGVSHGSVYTYWPDRSALFATLAHESAVVLSDHIEKAPCSFADSADGRAWLVTWLELVAAHGEVLHIWAEEVVRDERLGHLAREMQDYVGAFLGSVLSAAPAAGHVDRGAAHLVLWSLITEVPYRHCAQLGVAAHEDFLDAQTTLLMRGLLGHRR